MMVNSARYYITRGHHREHAMEMIAHKNTMNNVYETMRLKLFDALGYFLYGIKWFFVLFLICAPLRPVSTTMRADPNEGRLVHDGRFVLGCLPGTSANGKHQLRVQCIPCGDLCCSGTDGLVRSVRLDRLHLASGLLK